MTWFRVCGCSVPAVLAVLALAVAAPEPKTPDANEKAVQLVRALGDRSFRVREQAAKDLTLMGRAAFAALQAGAQDADPEVRQRCRKILPVIFNMEMKARLEAFTADTVPGQDHGLPGWQRFRALLGDDKRARDLFVRMIKADPQLMETVENNPKAFADERLAGRCFQLQQLTYARDPSVRTSITFGDVAQLLFLGSNPNITVSPIAAQMINQMLYQAIFQQALKGGDDVAAAKKLLLTWFDRNRDDLNTGNVVINLLQNNQVKELLEPTLKLATNKKVVAYVRASAMVAIGNVGRNLPNAKELAAQLEPFLKEDAVVSNFQLNNSIRGTTQLGDVALAAMIRISGQHPKDYGYVALRNNPNWIDSYYYLGFQGDKERAEARKKWQEFVEKQKTDKK